MPVDGAGHPTAADPVRTLIADPPPSPPPAPTRETPVTIPSLATAPPAPVEVVASPAQAEAAAQAPPAPTPAPAPEFQNASPPAPQAAAAVPVPSASASEPEAPQAVPDRPPLATEAVPGAAAAPPVATPPKPKKPKADKAKATKPADKKAPAAGEPVMRPPTIPEEADELLASDRPAPRELPRVIAIANQKGGVGKTTTTVNLGAALAELDYRVLVVDLDPQGNATTGLGIDARNFELSMYDVIMRDQPLEDCIEPTSVKNLFVAPATIDLAGIEIELVPAFSRELKLKRAIDAVTDDFDFILIDCPPSLGLLTVNGLAAAGEVMVPIQCEYYALEGLSQLLRNVNLVSSNLNETLEVTTIVLTMFDARTRLSIDVANEVREHFADRVCKSTIPRTVRLSEAPSFGQPITVFDPTSRGAVAYRELAKEVSNGAPQRAR